VTTRNLESRPDRFIVVNALDNLGRAQKAAVAT
jgi:hypothetical protein